MIGYMKKKNIFLLFMLTLSISILYGCNTDSSKTAEANEPAESAPYVQEVTILSDADITIPSALVGDEISELAVEEPSTINDESLNNTTTLSLTGEERTSIVNNISSEITTNITTILEDDDRYPNVTAITPNSDFTEFTISLKDGTMNTYESMLVMSFYMVGDKYQLYFGVPASEVKTVVKYINDATSEVISESDSTSMNTFTE